jgi:hypothetical protein
MLLHLNPSQIPSTYRQGYGFGYLLANLIVDLFLLTREAGVPQNYRRFSNCIGTPAQACRILSRLVGLTSVVT